MSDDTPTQGHPDGRTPEPQHTPQPAPADVPTELFPQPGGPSGDAPTERYPQTGDPAPTERMPDPFAGDTPTRVLPESARPVPHAYSTPSAGRIATAPPTTAYAPEPSAPTPEEPAKRTKGLLITLIVLSVILLAALIALIVWLLAPDGDQAPGPDTGASQSPAPEPAESDDDADSDPGAAEPEPTAPAPPPGPAPGTVLSFTASASAVSCPEGVSVVPVEFEWRTTGDSVTFAIGTPEAETDPYATGLDPNGSISVDYPCGTDDGEQLYSIAAYSGDDVVGRGDVTLWDE
ncbi:hypothetical protein [Salinibacterium sp. ZJ70]|uniref:hypothetical protein n=1 Tax=Salinibacterium sp. ZJ70 TaxID=2708084 RepID=UPI0014228665|nr:hypothetical protein [Salinibacterium sp. ZJ70]